MRPHVLSVPLAALLVSGCSYVHSLPSRAEPVNGKVITEEMIAQTNAATAWDVVEQSGYYRMSADPATGRTGLHSHRGKTSLLNANSDVPRVIVDGARVSDIGRLREIPAFTIAWMELLNEISGAAEEGTNSGAGVIRVITKVGR
jgi:TonB-dependent Receptor Plug Domain.